jgi:hypothetical protein
MMSAGLSAFPVKRQTGKTMSTATLVPAREPAAVQHIPLHKLRGPRRLWPDRLLTVFQGKKIAGVEWSMKFSVAGLVGNRFMVGFRREHWHQLDFSTLTRELAIPQSLWLHIEQDMARSSALFIAYEPDEGGGDTYRIYLELIHPPDALRREGVLPLGCGYKWRPATASAAAITHYRTRYIEDRAAFEGYLQPCLERLTLPVLRQTAQHIIARAAERADPRHFLFLEADEADTRRDSFTVTFHNAHLPLGDFLPSLLRLASSLGLSGRDVLDCLVLPNEPRSLSSLGAGISRDGHEFLTVYYD